MQYEAILGRGEILLTEAGSVPVSPTPISGLNPCQTQLATCCWDPVSQASGYFYQIVDQNNVEIIPRTKTTNTFSQSFEPLLGDTYTCTVWATTQDQESQSAKGTLICQSFLIPTLTPGEPTPTALSTIEPGIPTPTEPSPAWCQRADVNQDGAINARDFFAIVESYARQGRNLPGDLNQDEIVNALDLSLLLICMPEV